MFVKVCGLKTPEQIDQAVALGYDAIGVVLYPKSKRYVAPADARKLAEYAQGKITTVAVGVSNAEVDPVADVFDYVQTYEANPSPNHILAGGSLPEGYTGERFLYDTSKGSGEAEAFPEWVRSSGVKIILAGGLNPANVADVIQQYHPYGVDVSSGVETDGVKDFEKMKQFINEVRNAD